MPSSLRERSVDRLSVLFRSASKNGRQSQADTVDADSTTTNSLPSSRRRSTSLNRISSLLSRNSSTKNKTDDLQDYNFNRGRTPARRLSKSRPPSLNRSPYSSDFSSSRSSGQPPSSFRMPANARRLSSSSVLDTLDPPQPTFIDEAISRASSPSAGWKPASRPSSIRASSRPPSRMSTVPGDIQVPRPTSPILSEDLRDKKSKRFSLFGSSARSKSKPPEDTRPQCWIAGDPQLVPYDVGPLLRAEVVSELWDERGDIQVYLFPRSSGKGPSFKIRSSIFASSALLTAPSSKRNSPRMHPHAMHTPPDTPRLGAWHPHSAGGSRNTSAEYPPSVLGVTEFYYPVNLSVESMATPAPGGELSLLQEDVEILINVRNLIAFLVGGALVATQRRHTFFAIFLSIAKSLEDYNFTNIDGTTFGEAANSSFDCYVDELALADVRASCEKVIEALVLGESMRSKLLYKEAFAHAVGRYDDIQELSKVPALSTKIKMISRATRLRMERAYIDLRQRLETVDARLTDFDFPSLFIGSKAKPFKDDFMAMRRHVMGYYKTKYGSWPPKANPKKNQLRTDGLNRLVLKDLYEDLTGLYDLLTDRISLTTRAMDRALDDEVDERPGEPIARRLRAIFDEYDRSMPPVQPPIPFDTPLLPTLVGVRPEYGRDSKTDAKLRSKKLKDEMVLAVLVASRHRDIVPSRSPFLTSVCKFERKEARGKSLHDLVNLRAGIYLFLYVCIQALPMVVMDAPGVRHSHGVEYFLCQPPRKGVPWASNELDSNRHGMAWYGIAGGSGMVNLPSDLVENGVEGIFRRSHCWQIAKQWSSEAAAKIEETTVTDEVIKGAQAQAGAQQSMDSLPLRPPPTIAVPTSGSPVIVARSKSFVTPLASPAGSYNSSPLAPPQLSNPVGRSSSPMSRGRHDPTRHSALHLGLEELPPSRTRHVSASPAGMPRRPMSLREQQQPATTPNTGATFDDIIAAMERDKKKDAKRKNTK